MAETTVRVRAEVPMIGVTIGHVVVMERTALVEAAIADGRFTVIPDEEDGDEALRGEALDQALRDHGLRLTGRAQDKRRRLDAHMAGEHSNDELDDQDDEGGVPLAVTAAGDTTPPQ